MVTQAQLRDFVNGTVQSLEDGTLRGLAIDGGDDELLLPGGGGGVVAELIAAQERLLVAKVLLHCADISNPTKAWACSRRWAERVSEEFCMQVLPATLA